MHRWIFYQDQLLYLHLFIIVSRAIPKYHVTQEEVGIEEAEEEKKNKDKKILGGGEIRVTRLWLWLWLQRPEAFSLVHTIYSPQWKTLTWIP